MDTGDTPVDLTRLTKPEEEAFRTIARVLGARFAGEGEGEGEGDAPPASDGADGAGESADVVILHPDGGKGHVPPDEAGSEAGRTSATALLDRIPVPIVIAAEGEIPFANRAALARFAFPSTDAIASAGGLAALFDRDSPSGSHIAMRAADGGRFPAHVTMARIAWDGRTAMVVTILPAEGGRRPEPTSEDAAGEEAGLVDEEDRAAGAWSLDDAAPAHEGSPLGVALAQMRRLADEAAVLILTEEEDGAFMPSPGAEGGDGAEASFLRLLLLSVCARAPVGSVLLVRAAGECYRLDLSGDPAGPMGAAVASAGVRRLAAAAGFSLSIEEDGSVHAVRVADPGEPAEGEL